MGLVSLGRQHIYEFASYLHTNLAGQGELFSFGRQISKQTLRKGRWSSSTVASNSSRKRLFQNKIQSRYAKTVSADGAEEII